MVEVVVIAAGGTIASRDDGTGTAVAADTGADLVSSLPGAPAGVEVTVRDVVTVDSSALTLDQLDAIRAAVAQALESPDVAGVVVTHGTDTMEETSLLVDLSHGDPRPVVFTGAQHAADSPLADGPANLAEAITVAAAPEYRGLGVLLSFAGHVQTVRGLAKVSTVAPQPFEGGLPVAELGGTAPNRLLTKPMPVAGVRVDIVASYPGADGALVDAAVAAGADGIVLVGTGSGNTTVALADAVRRAIAAGVVVAVSTRVCTGEVDAGYGGGAGAADLVAAGAVMSRRLRPGQARIVLLALLAAGVGPRWIAAYLGR
ncbi:asparaginase domain-containing protein [Tsukamurella strandjordii]|uniref:Asparaginase domain-containing protein n=1 Tax=Tsukamurella strandjordii TaxID=147577 RepID=A0AA90NJ78_9ACTN|nr:asparaginase domain-containing protein [Tsukamurella strandjordii]MDP0399461.1 asparaginase domain-containing protein [Tsukamurella strandjordii]